MKKIIMIVLILIVLGVSVTFGLREYLITRTPTTHLGYSLYQLSKHRKADVSLHYQINPNGILMDLGGVEDDDMDQMEEMIENLNVYSRVKYDLADPDVAIKYEALFGIDYKSNPLFQGELFFSEESFGFGITNIDKQVYGLTMVQLFEYMELDDSQMFEQMDLVLYRDIIMKTDDDLFKDFAKNHENYTKPLMDYLDRHLIDKGKTDILINGDEVKVTQYELELDMDDYFELYLDLLEELVEDEAFQALVYDRANSLIETFISTEDYLRFDISKDEILEVQEEFIDEFNDQWDDFADEIEDGMDEMEDIYTYDMNLDGIIGDYEILFSIDRKHNLRQVKYTVKAEGIRLNMTYTYNAFDEDVKFSHADNYVDIPTLIDSEEFQNGEFLYDRIILTMETLLEAPGYQSLYEDLRYFHDYFDVDLYLDELENMYDEIQTYDKDYIKELLEEFIPDLRG